MRYFVLLSMMLALPACGTAPDKSGQSQRQQASLNPSVDLLLTSSATDFHTHSAQQPVGFRNVRLGYVMTPEESRQYMLCGEFLPAKERETAKWISFVTIKTSGYEQLIGAQAEGLCEQSSITWEKGDLSSSLQGRLDSLR